MKPRTMHLHSRTPALGPTAAPADPRNLDHERPGSEPAGDVRTASRYLTALGFRPAEAGNLTAYLHGLAPVEGGWTVDEIERLLFVGHLAAGGRIRS